MTRRVLVLGASGMLGNAVFRIFGDDADWDAFGTVRSAESVNFFPPVLRDKITTDVSVSDYGKLAQTIADAKPDVVINCVGVVKQLQSAKDPLVTIPINAVLPHQLARISADVGARFIHVSTDCVFDGRKGMYLESDFCDADDLYGRSKLLGEVDYPHAVTLRTSIIGHELNGGTSGLVGWFLSQSNSVKGFRKAIFSGFPTVTVARLMRDVVAQRPDLRGVYHVSSAPIDKFTLLSLVRDQYRKDIEIVADDALVIDRSLDSSRFRAATGYSPPAWPELVREMHAFG